MSFSIAVCDDLTTYRQRTDQSFLFCLNCSSDFFLCSLVYLADAASSTSSLFYVGL